MAGNIDWVYSAALRMVRDPHLADDVTQAVFLLLWQQPQKAAGKPLAPWLFNVTRYCAANALRGQSRRAKYERRAAAMIGEAVNADEPAWSDVSPLLEQMVARLRPGDREVILMRFYQSQSMAQIGTAIGVSEDAARKRVATAVQRLRDLLQRKGVVASVVGLSALMAANTTHAAPATLAASLGAVTPAVSTTVWQLAAGANKAIVLVQIQLATALTAALLLFGLVGWQAWRGASVQSAVQLPARSAPLAPPALAVTAPAATPPVELDLSTPAHALASLLASLEAGDRDRTYQCLTADPNRRRLPIDAFFDTELAANRASLAVEQRFGPAAKAQMQTGMATVAMVGMIFARNAEALPIADINGDAAQLSMTVPEALLGMLPNNMQFIVRQWSGAPVYFQKINGGWRMDIDKTCRVSRSTEDPNAAPAAKAAFDQQTVTILENGAHLTDEWTAQLKAGKWTTAAEARQAILRAQRQLSSVPPARGAGSISMLPATARPHSPGETGF